MLTVERRARRSLLDLLHPRGQLPLFAAFLALGLVYGWLVVYWYRAPLWSAVLFTVALLLVPLTQKWRNDRHAIGWPLTILSILLATQSFHTVEHLAQWAQYHLLGWPLKSSSGLISPLNAEIVHFVWNWAVLLVVAGLLAAGLRNCWMWLLLAWAAAHTAEHSYLFINYVQSGGVQGLPGFFGAGGWLASNQEANAALNFFCQIAPGLTAAPRLDVHFWWNVGEIGLLIPAAHVAMRRSHERRGRRAAHDWQE
jgi:hypothetical protein